jgi:hypothetical protein
MIFLRIILFFGIQALFALGFWLAGSSSAWESSASWWPFVVTIANLICIALMIRLFHQEGKNFWDIFRVRKEHIKSDWLPLVGILILLGPVSYLPNIWLGGALFGDPEIPLYMMLRPLPLWAAYASIILFPVTQGLAEGPTYFIYSMPRLEAQGIARWLAVSMASLMLAFQHISVPFLFDTRFILWRGLMFIPFAFLVGIALRWRARLVPYLAIIHVLLDVAFAAMLLGLAN